MKKRAGVGKKKGFTLLELVIAMGISFLLLLVLYYAYFLSQTFFYMGGAIIQEQMYVRNLFSKIGEDLQFVNRLNLLGEGFDTLEYEIFNRRVVSVESASNDKRVEGNTINYFTKPSTDGKYLILVAKVDKYEWTMKFGHSQKANDNEEPFGYPDDMRDSSNGKTETELGEDVEVLEQAVAEPFLMKSIQFLPYDQDGLKIAGETFDYSTLKVARSMRVEVTYLVKGDYGDTAKTAPRTKTATANILFVSFSMLSTVTEEGTLSPVPGFFELFCKGDVLSGFQSSCMKSLPYITGDSRGIVLSLKQKGEF